MKLTDDQREVLLRTLNRNTDNNGVVVGTPKYILLLIEMSLAQSEGEIPEWCCGINEMCGCHCHKKRTWHCEEHKRGGVRGSCPECAEEKWYTCAAGCRHPHEYTGCQYACHEQLRQSGYRDSTREPALKFEEVPEKLPEFVENEPRCSIAFWNRLRINEIIDYLRAHHEN